MKLVGYSEYLSNMKNEVPFKNLEVNILLDCERTISDTEKAHFMFQVSPLLNAFYSLKI